MCDYLVSKLCPGPKNKIPKWSDKTEMEHLFLIVKPTNEKGIFNINIYVNQGKSIAPLSSQRYKNSKVRKLFKKHGIGGVKNYEHYEKSGKRKLNLFDVEKEEEIFLPPSEKTLELINNCMKLKKKKRKTKKKEKPKKKKKRRKLHDSSSSDEDLGNESEEENPIAKIPVKLGLGPKKRPRPPAKGNNDDSSIDNDHERKRFKEFVKKLPFEKRKELIDEVIQDCYLENEEEAEKIFAGPEIMESLKDAVKNFETL